MTMSCPSLSRMLWPERIMERVGDWRMGSGVSVGGHAESGSFGALAETKALCFHTNFGAKRLHRTQGTLRFAGNTNLPSVVNHTVCKIDPLAFRQQLHQVLFDLCGVCVLG